MAPVTAFIMEGGGWIILDNRLKIFLPQRRRDAEVFPSSFLPRIRYGVNSGRNPYNDFFDRINRIDRMVSGDFMFYFKNIF